jgi:hypothetical protein
VSQTDQRRFTGNISTVLLGLSSGAFDRERADAAGEVMALREELERLRTLALDVDATLRTLKLLADRDARVNARTYYQQLERARARSRRPT